MGILSTVLKVVGVVAAVASGGILAGAVIALSEFAGGSVGKFFHSGWGRALTYAVAAASAYAGLSSAAGTAAAQQAGTTTGFLDHFVSGAKSFVNALAHPIDTAESLFGAGGTADIGTSGAAAGTSSGTLAANASQEAAQATSDTASAVGESGGAAGAVAANTPVDELAGNAAGSGTTNFADAASKDSFANSGDFAGSSATAGSPAAASSGTTDYSDAAAKDTYRGNSSSNELASVANTAASKTANGGLLSKALNFAKTPGGGQLIGNIVSGIGNGMSQNALMDKQIAAQNWANLQWRNPQLTQQVQAAAGAPLTVPAGYLSRANAVAGMMNGTPTTGPLMGPQPIGSGPGPRGAGTPMPSSPVRAGGT